MKISYGERESAAKILISKPANFFRKAPRFACEIVLNFSCRVNFGSKI